MSEKSIRSQIFDAVNELFAVAPTKPGQILVVGCSTSEVLGQKIGTSGDIHPAKDLFEVLFAETTNAACFLPANAANISTAPSWWNAPAPKNTVLPK